MKTIILVAGRGTRLGSLTEDTPKCLLKVGNQTILERILKQLSSNGIKEAVLVVGFKKEKIIEEIKRLSLPIKIKYIENRIYDQTNTIYSVWLAKKEAENGFILINGDVVSEDILIKELIEHPAKTVLTIDNVKKLGEEEVKIMIQGSKITNIGKQLDPLKSYGESIGVQKIRKEDTKILFEEIKKFVDRNEVKTFYESAFNNILDKVRFDILKTDGQKWTEVDFVEDYEEAKKIAGKV